jgi:hypothetical protein
MYCRKYDLVSSSNPTMALPPEQYLGCYPRSRSHFKLLELRPVILPIGTRLQSDVNMPIACTYFRMNRQRRGSCQFISGPGDIYRLQASTHILCPLLPKLYHLSKRIFIMKFALRFKVFLRLALCISSSRLSKTFFAHHFDEVIAQAEMQYRRVLDSRSLTYDDAVRKHISRRDLRPPQGFQDWFYLAKFLDATVIELFWDGIYEELQPLWYMDPAEILDKVIALTGQGSSSDRIYRFWIENHVAYSTCERDNDGCIGLLEML